ncbi:MAG: PAS domain S-box protein, partial [Actinomycetota bacterium]|nr:PAS domain S-box protein [Actinomycetota bacterium]
MVESLRTALRVLLVEDSQDDAFFLLRELRRGGYEVVCECVDKPDAFVQALDSGDWDIIVCDYIVPGFGALEALELVREKGSDLPFIIVSGLMSEDKAVEAMRVGAHDFINKSNLARLGPAVERELREAEVRRKHSSVEEELRRSEERFRATFEQAAVGIGHVALDGRWLRVNGKLCDVLGYSREEMLNLTFQQITHPDDLDKDLEQVRWMLDGEINTYSMEKRYVRKDGATIWANLTVSLVCGSSGEPEYFISVVEDVTERKRAEEAQRFLAQATTTFSASLDYRTTLASVAHLAVPYLADWCAVDMVEEDGTLVRLVVAHEDPVKAALAQELQERYPPNSDAKYGVPQVLRTGRSELVPEIPESLLAESAVDAEHREILHGMGLKSYLIVPLIARGRKLGAISLVSAESGRSYGYAELELAEELARRAALAVDNARLYEEAQREIAEREKAEAKLTRLASFPTLNPNPIIETNVAGEPSYLNPVAEEMFPDLPTLRNGHPLLADLESVDREIQRSGGRPITREVQVGGSCYQQSVSAVPGSDLLRLYSIDTTGLRQAEEALKKSEARFRSLIQNASDLIVVLDAAGTIRYESPAVERMLGFKPEERIGTNAFGHLHPDDAGPVREKFTELLENSVDRLLAEYRVRDREGYWRYFEAIGTNLLSDAIIRGVVINARDITERKIAEQHREAQHAVSRILAESASLEEAAPRFLETIGMGLKWELGALWMPDQSAGALRCEEIWRAPSVVAAEFAATSREMTFTPGQGLVGRVWESGNPIWQPDYLKDAKLPRHKSASKEGLHGACAFPIQNDGRILGVVDFFSYDILPPDRDMLQTVAILGSQIGQFIERRRGEKALRDSEERYRVVAQTASDAIFMIDEDSRILFVNDAAEKIFGYASEEMLGERLTMLMPEHLRHTHQDALKRYVDTGRRRVPWQALHLPGLHKSGKEIPLEISFGEFVKEGRRFFTGFIRDITERKEAEEALRETEEKYRGIFENAVDGIFQTSPDGRLLTANPALARMFGYGSPEEMAAEVTDVGRQLYADPGDRERLMHLIREHGSVSAFESRALRRDGEEIWIAVNAYLGSDASRELVCLEGTVEDITERKRAEEALRTSHKALADLKFAIDESAIVAFTDQRGRITHVNDNFCSISKYSREELIGQDHRIINSGYHPKEYVRNLWRTIANGHIWQGELKNRSKDGTHYWVDTTIVPFLNERGKPYQYVAIRSDITARKDAEEQARFLAYLNQTLQPLMDPDEVVTVAARMLGEHLGADRCAYAEVEADEDHFWITGDYTNGVPSIVGRFAMSQFGREALRLMRTNEPYVVSDAEADERLAAADLMAYRQTQIRAVVSVPLHKAGRFVAGMAVHQKTPRRWSREEIELVANVASRCWESIERARAARSLRQSEERFRSLVVASTSIVWTVDPEGRFVEPQ